MEFFVTSENGGGKLGGDFVRTFCSWAFGFIVRKILLKEIFQMEMKGG